MFDLIPDGTYTATIATIERRTVTTVSGPRVILDVTYALHDEHLAPEHRTVCQGLLLETTAAGELDLAEGKNAELNRIRAAVGQTEKTWNVAMLKGAGPLKVSVRLHSDENSPDVMYYDVRAS
jgi:hypothetical protein